MWRVGMVMHVDGEVAWVATGAASGSCVHFRASGVLWIVPHDGGSAWMFLTDTCVFTHAAGDCTGPIR